jgi:hypothetical protein
VYSSLLQWNQINYRNSGKTYQLAIPISVVVGIIIRPGPSSPSAVLSKLEFKFKPVSKLEVVYSRIELKSSRAVSSAGGVPFISNVLDRDQERESKPIN